MNDYLTFRVIPGLNDPKSVDIILSIPAQDFTLEEVNPIPTGFLNGRQLLGGPFLATTM